MTKAIGVGDFVRVLHTDYPGHIRVGDIVEVVDVNGSQGVDLLCKDGDGTEFDLYFYMSEVEKVDEDEPHPVGHELFSYEPAKLPLLQMKLENGISIDLDPNIPFSRKFAEAFLDAVYGGKNV